MRDKLYYAQKYMEQQTGTRSLSKLNKMLETNPNCNEKYSISVYLFISNFEDDFLKREKYKGLDSLCHELRNDLFNKRKFNNKELKELLDYANEEFKDQKNKFKDAFNAVEFDSTRSEKNNEMKNGFRKQLIDNLERTGFSLRFICEELDLKYSNVYNFLYKDNNSKLSTTNLAKIKMYFRNK